MQSDASESFYGQINIRLGNLESRVESIGQKIDSNYQAASKENNSNFRFTLVFIVLIAGLILGIMRYMTS